MNQLNVERQAILVEKTKSFLASIPGVHRIYRSLIKTRRGLIVFGICSLRLI